MASHLIFIGTYTKTTSRGIYSVRLDDATGALSEPGLAAETGSPTFIALSPDRRRLYAVKDSAAMVAAFSVDTASGRLVALPGPAAAAAQAPCHVAVAGAGSALVVANYHSALVAALAVGNDGSVGEPHSIRHSGRSVHPTRQTSSHPHSTTFSPDSRFVVACDLGLDRIYTYRLDPVRATLSPAEPPFLSTAPGAGPRHFAFGRSGAHGYAINELANTIVSHAYDRESGSLTPIQTVSTLPAGFAGESIAAEIRLHPNGRFLYASNRGHDSIAVFSVDPEAGTLSGVEVTPAGGRAPRNFALSPDGRWLVCAHQDSDSLCVFMVDGATGRLARVGGTVTVPMPVCVQFFD